MTSNCDSVPIAKVDPSNDWSRERIVGELNARLTEAIEKRGFFGSVFIEVHVKNQRIAGFDIDLKQQVRI